MPYTKKQCRYFGANQQKAPQDWKEKCKKGATKKTSTKSTGKRKR